MANRLKVSARPSLCLRFALVGFAVAVLLKTNAYAQKSEQGNLPVVCRAAVAAMMGHDISIVKLDKVDGGIAYVYYNRPSDSKLWKNRCRLDSDKVIWGTVDAFGPGTGFGRWRDHAEDEVVTYRLEGGQITILQTFSDGSKVTKNFAVKQ